MRRLTYLWAAMLTAAVMLSCGGSVFGAQEGELRKGSSGGGDEQKSRPANPVVNRSPSSKKPTARRGARAQPTASDRVEDAIEKGNLARDAKPPRYAEAETAYRLAAQLNPKEARAHYGLGNLFYDYERYPDAIEEYKQAARLKPDYAEAYSEMSRAAMMLDSCTQTACKEAEEAAQQAIRLNPVLASAYLRLGDVYNFENRYEEAIKQYKQAVRLKPDDAEGNFSLGYAYYSAKNYDDAIEALKQGIPLRPNEFDAWYTLAQSYDQLEKYEDAVDAYKEAARFKPESVYTHRWMGEDYIKLKNREGAMQQYRILKRLDSSQADSLCNWMHIENLLAAGEQCQ